MDLIDESGEIRATAYRDTVDKFYNMIEVDKVYYISKCQIKVANKEFTTLKNDYEMTLTNETIIEECHEDVELIPQTVYYFICIDQVANIAPGSLIGLIDLIGICKQVSNIIKIEVKTTGSQLKKRDVTLFDQSLKAIDLILWGTKAEDFNGSNLSIIAIKNAVISEFGGGKTVTTTSNSILKLDPDLPEARRLKDWYENDDLNINEITSISGKVGPGFYQMPWLSFKQVKANSVCNSVKGCYYQTVATILIIKADNCVYKACPSGKCFKRVNVIAYGTYHCEKCNRNYPNFKYRLFLCMNLADRTDNQWVNVFADQAEKVVGATAAEMGEALESNFEALMQILEGVQFKRFMFKLRSKLQTADNGKTVLKTVVFKVEPVDYKQYNRYLLSKINNA